MARSWFGGDSASFVYRPFRLGSALLPALAGGNVEIWTDFAGKGGVRITDLLDENLVPVSVVVADASGQVPAFQGPDGVNDRVLATTDQAVSGVWLLNTDGLPAAQARVEAETARDQAQAAAEAAQTTTDAMVAGRVNEPASQTRVALNHAFEQRATVNVKDHGAVGDWNGSTGTDNLAAFDAAAAEVATNGAPATIVIPAGRYWLSDDWMLDGDNLAVQADPNAEIITTSPTTRGAAVTFMGNGVLSPNTQTTPQRNSFSWRGGKITATGSAGADNALGVVRVKSVHVSDVTLDADRKGLTAQYGVDNIWWERVRVTRAGSDGLSVETDCKVAALRSILVDQAAGIGINVTSGDAARRCTDILLDGVVVTSAGSSGISIGLSDRVTLRKTRVVAAATQGLYVSETTGLSVSGDSSFTSIVFGSNVTHKKPSPVVVPLSGGWVSFGAPLGDLRAYKTSDGMVVLTGAIKSGALTANATIATLPVGYRPAERVVFTASNPGATPPSAPYMYINADGTLQSGAALGSSTMLAMTVTFPAA